MGFSNWKPNSNSMNQPVQPNQTPTDPSLIQQPIQQSLQPSLLQLSIPQPLQPSILQLNAVADAQMVPVNLPLQTNNINNQITNSTVDLSQSGSTNFDNDPAAQLAQLSQLNPVTNIKDDNSNIPIQVPVNMEFTDSVDNVSPEKTEAAKKPVSATRRAAQNRSAQKAFRKRKERYIKDLEAQVAEVPQLKRIIEDLKTENMKLRDYTIFLQGKLIDSSPEIYKDKFETKDSANVNNAAYEKLMNSGR